MSDTYINSLMSQIGGVVEHSLDEAGGDVVDDVKDLISVPVEYVGSHIIRSKPGEPPRKETGYLTDSISKAVDQNTPNVYVLTILVEAEYATYLENGTDHMAARPFVGPTETKWEGLLTNRLALSTRQLP